MNVLQSLMLNCKLHINISIHFKKHVQLPTIIFEMPERKDINKHCILNSSHLRFS